MAAHPPRTVTLRASLQRALGSRKTLKNERDSTSQKIKSIFKENTLPTSIKKKLILISTFNIRNKINNNLKAVA